MKLFGRSQMHREMREELQSHIQHRADDLERTGLARAEAERRARLEFGGYERFREESRKAAGAHFGDVLGQDLRFGLRMMRRSPGFTAVAILTLGIGIAANSVVFSVLNGLVLRRLDLPRAESLYMVEFGKQHLMQSYPDYFDMRDRTRTFEGMVAFDINPVGLDNGQGASRAWLYEASGNYFDVLGVRPYLGRFFHASDEHGPDSAPYAVLGYAYWHSHFQGDKGIVGRTIQLNKHPFTVIGVAPPEFVGTTLLFSADLWTPLVNQAQIMGGQKLTARAARSFWIIGRLKAGATVAQLTDDLTLIATSLGRTYPKEDEGITFSLTRPELMGDFIGKAAREFVAGLMVLAALILLAACANLGSLFAARAADRSREIALRISLGSSRGRIMRQLLTEAVLISLAGGVLGLAASAALVPALSAWQPLAAYPLRVPVNPDTTVYVVALLLALFSGLLFGLAPMRQVFSTSPNQVVKSHSAGVSRRLSLRDLLLVGQIAICAVLVTASLVAVRGLVRSLHSNFGFLEQNVTLVNADLAMAGYTGEKQLLMERRILDAALAIPGVTAAAWSNTLPLDLNQDRGDIFTDDTADLRASKSVARTMEYAVSPGYFEAAGTTLLAGRAFTWHDDKNAPSIAVVNRQFARRIFGSVEKALGGYYKHRDGKRIEIIGIAEDGKYETLTEDPKPAAFLPILQGPDNRMWLIVRSSGDSDQRTAAALNRTMRDLDSGLPFTIKSWYDELDSVMFPARAATVSLGLLGALGAMLALTGIFGMAAYSVSKRLREFGIRVALGAKGKEVLSAALGRTLRALVYGSAAGVLLGIAASKVLSLIVYEATPRDPMVLAGVLLTMLAVGLAAAWIPAMRALSTDPSILLRED